RSSRWRSRFWRDLPVHLFLFTPNASVVFLLYYLASNTLKPKSEFYRLGEFAWPQSLSLEAIENAVKYGGMLVALRNSLILTALSTVFAVFFGACAAYAVARLKLPWKYPIYAAILVPMSISPMIITIPLFAQMAGLGLINTFT